MGLADPSGGVFALQLLSIRAPSCNCKLLLVEFDGAHRQVQARRDDVADGLDVVAHGVTGGNPFRVGDEWLCLWRGLGPGCLGGLVGALRRLDFVAGPVVSWPLFGVADDATDLARENMEISEEGSLVWRRRIYFAPLGSSPLAEARLRLGDPGSLVVVV